MHGTGWALLEVTLHTSTYEGETSPWLHPGQLRSLVWPMGVAPGLRAPLDRGYLKEQEFVLFPIHI